PEPEEQEAMIVEQDISMVEAEPSSDTAMIQPKVDEEVVKTGNSTGSYIAPTIITIKENIPLGSPNVIMKSNKQRLYRGLVKKKAKNKKVLNERRKNRGHEQKIQNLTIMKEEHIRLYISEQRLYTNVQKIETKFGNLDHLLVCCSLYQNRETAKPTLWKLNSCMLDNLFIAKEIKEDLKEAEEALDWDF
ncbi:6646_t:CDS:2, partial [Gigaspora rosea]